jgi:hypothetical protein
MIAGPETGIDNPVHFGSAVSGESGLCTVNVSRNFEARPERHNAVVRDNALALIPSLAELCARLIGVSIPDVALFRENSYFGGIRHGRI